MLKRNKLKMIFATIGLVATSIAIADFDKNDYNSQEGHNYNKARKFFPARKVEVPNLKIWTKFKEANNNEELNETDFKTKKEDYARNEYLQCLKTKNHSDTQCRKAENVANDFIEICTVIQKSNNDIDLRDKGEYTGEEYDCKREKLEKRFNNAEIRNEEYMLDAFQTDKEKSNSANNTTFQSILHFSGGVVLTGILFAFKIKSLTNQLDKISPPKFKNGVPLTHDDRENN